MLIKSPERIRRLRKEDYAEAAGLTDRVFSGSVDRWLEHFAHWWEDNPSWSSDIPRGWIAFADGRSVAFMANICFPYRRRDGGKVVVAAASSLAVDPAMRGMGLAKEIGRKFLSQEDVDVFLGIGSTGPAERLWTSLGMAEIRREWTDARFLLIGSPTDLVEHLASRWRWLPRLAVVGAQRLVTMGEGLAGRAAQQTGGEVCLQSIDRFSEEDAAALGELSMEGDIGRNVSPANLNWFYFGSETLRKTRTVVVAKSGGRLVGYIGCRFLPVRSKEALSVMECRTVKEQARLIHDTLMKGAIRCARERGCPYVTVRPDLSEQREAVTKRLHFLQKNQRQTYVYKMSERLGSTVMDTRSCDGDVAIL